jgi:hypothetical protein
MTDDIIDFIMNVASENLHRVCAWFHQHIPIVNYHMHIIDPFVSINANLS